MKRAMHHLLIANALGAFDPPRPGICSADYATGWDEVSGGSDYQTVGDNDGYDTGAAMPQQQMRRAAPLALRPVQRPMQPVPNRSAPQYRPTPASPGPSPAQVQAIARAEIAAAEGRFRGMVTDAINEAIASRVPYGDIPPRPNQDEAMFPMGLGSVTLTSLAPTGSLIARPQRAFRGERLVLSVQRSVGAPGVIANLLDFQIGDYKQLVGGGSLPADVFASDAFGVRLMLDGSVPGVLYQIDFGATVPAGEFVIVTGAVIGRAGEAAQR